MRSGSGLNSKKPIIMRVYSSSSASGFSSDMLLWMTCSEKCSERRSPTSRTKGRDSLSGMEAGGAEAAGWSDMKRRGVAERRANDSTARARAVGGAAKARPRHPYNPYYLRAAI